MSYTAKEYRLDLQGNPVELPPCVGCTDEVIEHCMKTSEECPSFIEYAEPSTDGFGRNRMDYREYHKEYYRKNRDKLLAKLRKSRGNTRTYNTKLVTMPQPVKEQILTKLEITEKTFYEYINDGKSETASKVLTHIHELCDYVRRG